jgi:HD-like signal output (HDOD) protein
MAFAMAEMEKQDWPDSFRAQLTEIRKTSKGVAGLCFATGKHVQGVRAAEALATGFFHLVGKLYLLARARQEDIPPADVADWMKALKAWHPTIGRTILDHWKIPAAVAEAVEHQNAIFDSEGGRLAPLTLILCASKLYYRLRKPDAAPEPEAEAALARVRLHGQTFDDLQKAIKAA